MNLATNVTTDGTPVGPSRRRLARTIAQRINLIAYRDFHLPAGGDEAEINRELARDPKLARLRAQLAATPTPCAIGDTRLSLSKDSATGPSGSIT